MVFKKEIGIYDSSTRFPSLFVFMCHVPWIFHIIWPFISTIRVCVFQFPVGTNEVGVFLILPSVSNGGRSWWGDNPNSEQVESIPAFWRKKFPYLYRCTRKQLSFLSVWWFPTIFQSFVSTFQPLKMVRFLGTICTIWSDNSPILVAFFGARP